MTAYLAWWFAGGGIGLATAAWVLRRGHALTGAAATAFVAATFGCLYGAKVQYRLRLEPVWDAMAVPLGDLLTPGYHIPLGLVFGLATAMCVARALRGSPLRVADALTLAGAVMMPIGRIGCMVAGCCTGTVCPAWWPFGIRFGPRTAAYGEQVSAGLLPPDAPLSLPVHSLPVYFAVLGIVTAVVAFRQLRRNARPGTVAAVGSFLYAAGQLAIERLRVPSDDRGPVMTVVLVGMMLSSLLVALAIRWRAAQEADRASNSSATCSLQSDTACVSTSA